MPPPNPKILRARFRPLALVASGSNFSLVWAAGGEEVVDPQKERLTRRPKLVVPAFLAHMMSNSSLLFRLGSLVLTLELSPVPRWGVISRRWMAHAPVRPSIRFPMTEPNPRSTP